MRTKLFIATIIVSMAAIMTGFAQDIYVAGYDVENAILWKNGAPQSLNDDGMEAAAYSVSVSDMDIYVAGYERNEKGVRVAALWNNDTPQRLGNGDYDSYAYSLFISGDDVYVAGQEGYEERKEVAVLWKNGVPQRLGGEGEESAAKSVFIDGNDVYVVGYIGGFWDNSPVFWKNGEVQILDGYSADAVYVADGDVYIAGCRYNQEAGKKVAVLWKNGVLQELSNKENNAYAHCVYVVDGNVYVGGTEELYDEENQVVYTKIAIIWKNGVATQLEASGFAEPFCIYVTGKDIYAGGYEAHYWGNEGPVATIWKNGKKEMYDDGFYIYSIFVK